MWTWRGDRLQESWNSEAKRVALLSERYAYS